MSERRHDREPEEGARAPIAPERPQPPRAQDGGQGPELVLEGPRVVEQPLPGEERGLIGLRGLLERAALTCSGMPTSRGPYHGSAIAAAMRRASPTSRRRRRASPLRKAATISYRSGPST